MKTLLQIINKTYDKQLLDYKQFKKDWEKKRVILCEYEITCDKKDDEAIFMYEIIYESIMVKQMFEETFFNTYVHMFDYWYDLTYLERKQQMNTDIDRLMDSLPSFMEGDQKIFMPCFDVSFNHLYTDEIVLLDLKQYHAFIRTFVNEIKSHIYGVRPFEIGCSSAQVCVEKEQDFVLYHPLTHRLYRFKDNCFDEVCSLDPKSEITDDDQLRDLADAFLADDEAGMLALMLQGVGMSSKMMKKLKKYQKKYDKKMVKGG